MAYPVALPPIEAYAPKQPILKSYDTPEDNINNIITTINKIRKDNDLPALTQDQRLNVSAAQKANDLVTRKYWAHKDPDGNMSWDLIKNAGYNYQHAGENLSKNYNNINSVDAWLLSPTHRDNILNPDFTNVGIGNSGNINVLHFGKEQK